MAELKDAIEPDDIDWIMDWGDNHPTKPPFEPMFEPTMALAHLLMNEVVFLNSAWWEKDWPKQAREAPYLFVCCNDIFEWAMADGEPLPYKEIENLYRMWRKDPEWGDAVWCIMQRGQMPQQPVAERIAAGGIWDLPKMFAERAATIPAIGEGSRDAV